MNNDFNRFILIRSINIYHHQIYNLIEKFYQKQRDYQLRIDARRYNWFITCDEERDSFKKEIFKTKLNTIKNIQDFNRPQDPSKISLEFNSLMKILINHMIYKYRISQDSFYKFLDKLHKNQIKTFKQKELEKTKKILSKHLTIKINNYKASIINYVNLRIIINDIQQLKFTTEKTKIERRKIVSYLDNIIQNNQTKKYDNINSFVNYLPDHIFTRINMCIK